MSTQEKIYIIFEEDGGEYDERWVVAITTDRQKAQKLVDFFAPRLLGYVSFVEYDLKYCEDMCDKILSGNYKEYTVYISKINGTESVFLETGSNYFTPPNEVEEYRDYYHGHVWARNKSDAITQFKKLVELAKNKT